MLAESWRQDPDRENVWRFRIRPGLALPVRRAVRRGGRRRCAPPPRRPGRGADQRLLLAQRRRRARRGRRGAGRAARAERRHAAAAALLALGDPQPGRAPARPATTFGRTTADGTGPFTFVESVSGSHLDVARWEGYRGPRTTWEANARARRTSTAIRWIPILDDRERAAALERGEIDCLQNASLLDVDRLAREPRPRGDRVPAVGARLHGSSTARRVGQRRPRPARDLAGDRPAGARRPRPRRVTAGRRTRRSRRTRSGTRRRSRRPAATTRARRRSCSTRPASHRAPTASGSSSRRSSSTTPTVRRVAETIREMLAAVGVRLELDGDPGLRRVLRPPQRASAGVHLEVVLARADRRDRRLHRHVGPGRRAELPALERRGARPRLPRLGGRPATTRRSARPRATSSCAPPSACR